MADDAVQWYLLLGLLLISSSALGPLLHTRLISPVHLQLLGGIAAGPWGLQLIHVNFMHDTRWLEVASEIAVIISLYAAGVKLRMPLASGRWRVPLTLATVTMTVSVVLTALVAVVLFSMPIPVALLLGAVLAPTDPVLADKVQVEEPDDDDRLRQSLTGEAGMNDGTAFPFVLLALALLQQSDTPLSETVWHWFLDDLLWKVIGGVVIGVVAGHLLARAVLWLRRLSKHPVTSEELLTLGLILIVYGVALGLDTYAFLAVFSAAVTLRRFEMQDDRESTGSDRTDSTALLQAQTEVGTALERITQVFLVFIVGVLLSSVEIGNGFAWLFAAVMIFAVRPLAVYLTIHDRSLTTVQKRLVAWFGIRGIGSIFYLAHALEQGARTSASSHIQTIVDCCIVTIVTSILLHGLSETPLMRWYRKSNLQAEAG